MSYQRANTEWMRGNFGFSFHWTANTLQYDGSHLPYEEAVNNFDVKAFAEELASLGAQHCIFTLTHAKHFLGMPHPVVDKILPGRTTKRDFLGELIAELDKHNIRFIAYYNHSCNGQGDAPWREACGYAAGIHGNLDHFAENICNVVEYIAKRYGTGIGAWWFDSSYSVDPRGPHNTISCEMGDWQFPWQNLCNAAKGGYRDCAVTFNAGVGSCFMYADCQDYYAGETEKLDEVFTPEALPGMADHRWICVDYADWVFNVRSQPNGFVPLRFPAEDINEFRRMHCAEGRMVTFNVLIDQSGKMNPAMKQLALR